MNAVVGQERSPEIRVSLCRRARTLSTSVSTQHKLLLVLFTLAGLAFAWHTMRRSPGVFTDDEIGHLLISRDAWHEPALILNVWGRMLFTLLYMIPARIGWGAARLFSLLISTGTVIATAILGRKLGLRYFWLLPALLWFQPLFGTLAFNAITEIPFSALFVAAGLLFVSRRYSAAAFCVGLLPLIRYEGAAFIGIVFLLCMVNRKWKPLIYAVLPLLIQNGLTMFGLKTLPLDMFFHPTQQWLSGHAAQVGTAVTSFGFSYRFRMLPEIAGLPVMLLVVFGLPHLLKRKEHVLVFGCYLLYFCIHVVITGLSLYGEQTADVRYLLPLAPGLAMVAAVGLESAVAAFAAGVRKFAGRTAMVAARAAALSLCALAVGVVGLRNIVPIPKSAEQLAMEQVTDWVRHHPSGKPTLSTDVWFYFLLPERVNSADLWVQFGHLQATSSSGTYAVWDNKYSETYGIPLSAVSAPAWKEVYAVRRPLPGNPNADFDIRVFEKSGTTARKSVPPSVGKSEPSFAR